MNCNCHKTRNNNNNACIIPYPVGVTGPAGPPGLTISYVGNSIFVDSIFGKTPGEIENFTDPYLYINDAANAAGQAANSNKIITVYVRPGTYIVNDNLARNYVNWYFEEGTYIIGNNVIFEASSVLTGFDVRGYGVFQSNSVGTLFNIGNSTLINNVFNIEGKSATITSLNNGPTSVININNNLGQCNVKFDTVSIVTMDAITNTDDNDYSCINIFSQNVVININDIFIYLPNATVTLGRFTAVNILTGDNVGNGILINSNKIYIAIKGFNSSSTTPPSDPPADIPYTQSYLITILSRSVRMTGLPVPVTLNSRSVLLITNDVSLNDNHIYFYEFYTVLINNSPLNLNSNNVVLIFTDNISSSIDLYAPIELNPTLKNYSYSSVVIIVIGNSLRYSNVCPNININTVLLYGNNVEFSSTGNGISCIKYWTIRPYFSDVNIIFKINAINVIISAGVIDYLLTFSNSYADINAINILAGYISYTYILSISFSKVNIEYIQFDAYDIYDKLGDYYYCFILCYSATLNIDNHQVSFINQAIPESSYIFDGSNVNFNYMYSIIYSYDQINNNSSTFNITSSTFRCNIFSYTCEVGNECKFLTTSNSYTNINRFYISPVDSGIIYTTDNNTIYLNNVYATRMNSFLNISGNCHTTINYLYTRYDKNGGSLINIGDSTSYLNINKIRAELFTYETDDVILDIFRSAKNINSHINISYLEVVNTNISAYNVFVTENDVAHINIGELINSPTGNNIAKILTSEGSTVYFNTTSINITTKSPIVIVPNTVDLKYLIDINDSNFYFDSKNIKIINNYTEALAIINIHNLKSRDVFINGQIMRVNRGLININNDISLSKIKINIDDSTCMNIATFIYVNSIIANSTVIITGRYVNSNSHILMITGQPGDTSIKLSNCVFLTSGAESIMSINGNNISLYSPSVSNNDIMNINFSPAIPLPNNWYLIDPAYN